MKTLLYLFLFVLCLLAAIWSFFMIGDLQAYKPEHFPLLILLSFLSLGGTMIFGYVFFIHAKELKL